jgi:hypothetical protein
MSGAKYVFVVALLTFFAQSQTLPANLLATPAKLQLDKTSAEVKRGTAIEYTVSLKNGRNQPVTALEDMTIEVVTDKGGSRQVSLPRGQSSAHFTWVADPGGMVTLTVRSGKLLPSSCLVLVTDNSAQGMSISGPNASVLQPPLIAAAPSIRRAEIARDHRPIRRVPSEVTRGVGPDTETSPAPAAAGPPGADSPPAVTQGLGVFILPDKALYDAQSHTWGTKVMVAVQNPQGGLSPVANDTDIFLTPNIGLLSASTVTIQQGKTSNFNSPLILTSTRPGTDTVLAMSGLGRGSAQVAYQMPQASRLRLAVWGSNFEVSGAGVRPATVCLEDDSNNLVETENDVRIMLNTTLGDPSLTEVVVPAKGICSKEIKFSSRAAGTGRLTAQSIMGLKADTADLIFPPFPWHLVWLAVAGGVIGAFVGSYGTITSKGWWSSTWRNAIVGAVFGGAAYLFACFGALVLPEGVPVLLQNIPTASKVGASLIGFLGGLLWRKIWKLEAASSPAAEQKAA